MKSFNRSYQLKCHIISGVCNISINFKDDPVMKSRFNPNSKLSFIIINFQILLFLFRNVADFKDFLLQADRQVF
jgi:hypothetical protein